MSDDTGDGGFNPVAEEVLEDVCKEAHAYDKQTIKAMYKAIFQAYAYTDFNNDICVSGKAAQALHALSEASGNGALHLDPDGTINFGPDCHPDEWPDEPPPIELD